MTVHFSTLEEATYIFIVCYVHILHYDTATIHGNATQSGLHSYRVRPQRSGTVVMRHNIECTISTAYIFGFMGITQHGHRECKFQSRESTDNKITQTERMIHERFP